MNENINQIDPKTANVKPDMSLANAPLKKKIGFFSAISIVMGSSIGAGIFFKSSTILDYSGGNLYWAIFCWIIAAFAVICMALALIEISSARNDNLSMIGWCKTFNGKYVYKGCKYFMTFIYLPLTFFFMPLYVLLSVQDALSAFKVNNNFGTNNDWVIWTAIGLVISIYFIFVCGFSAKATNIQNWIITSLKFIPLIAVTILGFVLAAMPLNNEGNSIGGVNVEDPKWWDKNATSIFNLSPAFGLFGGMAAIFFAFDGFYVTAGLQTEMREPKKTPKAIFLGLLFVTIIYIVIAISMSLSGGGDLYSFNDWLDKKNALWVSGVFNILIAIGVLGIINGFAAWAPRFVEDLIKEGELVVPRKTLKYLDRSIPVLGTWYTLILSVPTVIIFSIIGGLGYFEGKYGNNYDGSNNVHSQAKLLNFADLMATWVSLFAFAFIVLCIFGGLMNRKTNRVKTQKFKYFVFSGWTSFILVCLSLVFSVIEPFANLGLIISQQDKDLNQKLIGNILLCVILILFAFISFGLVLIEEKLAVRRLKKLEAIYNAVNFKNQIIDAAKTQIINKNKSEFKKILMIQFNVELSYVKYVVNLPWNILLSDSNKSNEIFNETAINPLKLQIQYTKDCIASCHLSHSYFVKK